MTKQVKFKVHKERYDDCLKKISTNHGKLSSLEPHLAEEDGFIKVEVYFFNDKDLNTFIYQAYFTYGTYFLLDVVAPTNMAF